jgi:dolichol-phosphate mannosyltransferase
MPTPTEQSAWVAAGIPGMLSVVIPAHNERDNLRPTISSLAAALEGAGIAHEILVVNDHSSDDSAAELVVLAREFPALRHIVNEGSGGFGLAVRAGLEAFRGDRVAIVMADSSDDPADVVRFHRKLDEGYDCVFGTRFARGGTVVDYPPHKLVLNRLTNWAIRFLFRLRTNDTTNAFKCYRREVIAGVQPILSQHFNLTVELPLKAIIRGYSYAVVPNAWYNRKVGLSKLRIREMGSRYLFIILYCLIERHLSRGDYRRQQQPLIPDIAEE